MIAIGRLLNVRKMAQMIGLLPKSADSVGLSGHRAETADHEVPNLSYHGFPVCLITINRNTQVRQSVLKLAYCHVSPPSQ
jgi:hypothetical protein